VTLILIAILIVVPSFVLGWVFGALYMVEHRADDER
jgi:hypothetical protein